MTLPAELRAEADSRKPFHRLSDSQFKAMQDAGMKWNEVSALHPQPSWCDYPGALDGPMGCWSLVGRMVRNKAYCKGCDCMRKAK